jgi:hypothetical protein
MILKCSHCNSAISKGTPLESKHASLNHDAYLDSASETEEIFISSQYTLPKKTLDYLGPTSRETLADYSTVNNTVAAIITGKSFRTLI